MRLRNRLPLLLAYLAIAAAALRLLFGPPLFMREIEIEVHEQSESRGEPGDELVVFVVIDTLRPDHLSHAGYSRATSPVLDRLARQGLFVPELIAHSSHTAPSMASLLTSKFPFQHGVQYDPENDRFGTEGDSEAPLLESALLSLPEVLAKAGYYTAAVVANPWLAHDLGFAQGFARYVESLCHMHDEAVCDGAQVNEEAFRILAAHAGEKLFLYLHYMDVHNPYAHAGRLPRRFRTAEGELVHRNGPGDGVSQRDLAYSMAAYDEGIVYVDGLIGELVRRLETEGRAAHTTLIVTSDHGEEFMEHGGLGHGTTLHDELIDCFAIVWSPGDTGRPHATGLRGSVDLFPTVLEVLGLPPLPGLEGTSLLAPAPPERPLYAELAREKAVYRAGHRLTHDARSGAFALSSAGQRAGGASAAPDAAMRAQLEADLARMEQAAREAPGARLGERRSEELRQLGYLRDGDAARSDGPAHE